MITFLDNERRLTTMNLADVMESKNKTVIARLNYVLKTFDELLYMGTKPPHKV